MAKQMYLFFPTFHLNMTYTQRSAEIIMNEFACTKPSRVTSWREWQILPFQHRVWVFHHVNIPPLIIHSAVDGRWGGFLRGAITNSVAVSILAHGVGAHTHTLLLGVRVFSCGR